MKRNLVLGALIALGAVGCASSTKLEDQSRVHSLRADAAAQVRDYDRAAKEKSEATRLHEKAVKRAYKEGNTSGVIVPSAVPEPPPPNSLP